MERGRVSFVEGPIGPKAVLKIVVWTTVFYIDGTQIPKVRFLGRFVSERKWLSKGRTDRVHWWPNYYKPKNNTVEKKKNLLRHKFK